jgi:hypothetical protein
LFFVFFKKIYDFDAIEILSNDCLLKFSKLDRNTEQKVKELVFGYERNEKKKRAAGTLEYSVT